MDRRQFASNIYPWIAAALLLVPWLYIQHQTSINSNTAWLTICAERLLTEQPLSQSCFDTNPPLNILVYIPFILISKLLPIELYSVIFWGTLALTLAATYTTNKFLRHTEVFTKNERTLLSLSLLCTLTIIPTIYFAERDHFIAIALFPFILVQLSITYQYRLPPALKYATLIIGTLALLIKPHFLIIPAFLLLHRISAQKSIGNTTKSPDFIIIAALSIGYLCMIWLFFQDFLTLILPDILRFYLNYNNPAEVFLYVKIYGFITLSVITLSFLIVKPQQKTIIAPIALCTLLSLAVFVIQMKGFTYHRLPLYALLFPLSTFLIYKLIARKLKTDKATTHCALISAALITIFTASYIFSPPRPNYATHEDYKNSQLLNYINKHCAQPCAFYITHENMDIVSQLAFYSNHLYATRFPAFWFQPGLEGKVKPVFHANYSESIEDAKIRYANYIAEDITRISPALILIERPKHATEQSQTFTGFYAVSKKFQNVISQYKKFDSLTIDRAYFYKDTKYDHEHFLTWDVYKKSNNHEQ